MVNRFKQGLLDCMEIGKTLEVAAENAFEIVSILIAAAALVYAALAFNASKQAIEAAEKSDISALRVKALDVISDARRSFTTLQEACILTRRAWEIHNDKHLPALGLSLGASMFSEQKETQHISRIERTGSKSLNELLVSLPETDNSEEWHEFIARAQSASTGIERLKLGLKGPKSLHY